MTFEQRSAVVTMQARKVATPLLLAASFLVISAARAQPSPYESPAHPVVTVTASASRDVTNDRMTAVLRAEADDMDASRAANQVNQRMARALAHAKAQAGVEARTAGYSSYQVSEPNKPARWRVSQSLSLESSDFVALSALVSKLQGDDRLLLSGVAFDVSPQARRTVENELTVDAIRRWQERAQIAARAFGAEHYRAGRVTVQTNELGRPQPMFKAGVAASASVAPISVEGGTSEVTVAVSGEAILDANR